MDTELLVALMVLWLSTTTALVFFLRMWFAHDGEAFHPHSVDVDHRHGLFLAVSSRTMCKLDCPVKSISSFVAPRGSSSSKQFTVLSCMIAVAGFLGTSRWYAVGGVSFIVAVLCFVGFASLLLVAAFELDVIPDRYLEDKLLVTAWLIRKLGLEHKLAFTLDINSVKFRQFIRSSKEIYHLYEEDLYMINRPKKHQPWIYHSFWSIVHMIGASSYVILVPIAILLHDKTEAKVAWITGSMFFFFCTLSYLSGQYVPVLRPWQGLVLMWNPFLREPHFMLKLKRAVENYYSSHHHLTSAVHSPSIKNSSKNNVQSPTKESKSSQRRSATELVKIGSSQLFTESAKFYEESQAADQALDSIPLRYARSHPAAYLKIIGHIGVMSELVAMLTPSVALGLQWVTALCSGPSLLAVIDLLIMVIQCIRSGDCSFTADKFQHCILKT